MRNVLLQIVAALVLTLLAVTVWKVVGRRSAAETVPVGASQPSATDAVPLRSGLPEVIYIDPAGFLPAALSRNVEESYENVPLREAAEGVGKVAGLPCRIQEEDLKEEGADSDSLVTLPAEMPLYMALDQLCNRHAWTNGSRLDWYIEDDVIVLTTETAAADKFFSHGFEASQVVRLWSGDWQSIIDVLQSHCGYDCQWMDIDRFGGEIDIAGNVLMVRQTYRDLRKVSDLLDAMQRRAATVRVGHAPRDAVLYEALEQPVNGWFHDIALETAIASLSEQCSIPIEFAATDLADEGVRVVDAVFCELRDQPLRVVLDTMLHEVNGAELSYLIRDGAIWITTATAQGDYLETAFYQVDDLLFVMRDHDLVDLVQSQVSGEWMDIDGFGGEVDVMPGNYLIVSATWASQIEVKSLLANLRGSLVIPGAGDPNAIISRTYLLSATLAEDLEKVLSDLVAPESWHDPYRLSNSGQGRVYSIRIDADHTSLVIQQTLENHRQIEALLNRIDPRGLGHRTY